MEPPLSFEGLPSPVRWSDDGEAIALLDQTLLPTEERYLRLECVEEVAEAISALRVRGAPAIGIAAALGLAMGARNRLSGTRAAEELDALETGIPVGIGPSPRHPTHCGEPLLGPGSHGGGFCSGGRGRSPVRWWRL